MCPCPCRSPDSGPGGAGLACQVLQRARSPCQLCPSCGLQSICSQVPSLGGRAGRREPQNRVTPGPALSVSRSPREERDPRALLLHWLQWPRDTPATGSLGWPFGSCVCRAQLSGRAWWGLFRSCCVRLLWSLRSWLCHLSSFRVYLCLPHSVFLFKLGLCPTSCPCCRVC